MSDTLTTTALILGLVEGITEFLPISSTGHMIIVGDLLGFTSGFSKLFEVVIQLGAILAVCWLYRQKLWQTLTGIATRGPAQIFARNVLVAFLPAVVIGLLAHDFIKRVLFSPNVVGWAFVVGGVAILAAERWRPTSTCASTEEMPIATAAKIGVFQCLAMIPGTSRSGATRETCSLAISPRSPRCRARPRRLRRCEFPFRRTGRSGWWPARRRSHHPLPVVQG